jgi:hypothetical protein
MMDDIIKYYAIPDVGAKREIPVYSNEDAVDYVRREMKDCGEVRVIRSIYRHLCSTPFIVSFTNER